MTPSSLRIVSRPVDDSSPVSVTVYDLLGRRVSGVPTRNYTRGWNEISWTPETLAPGVYIAMNAYIFKAGAVIKNFETARFEETSV